MNKVSSFLFSLRGYFMAPYGILLLILGKPTTFSFLVGLGVALLGECLRIWGVGYAGKCTRKSSLDAPKLVTAGPYALVRHPLYIGNSLMGLGGLIMASGRAGFVLTLTFLAGFFLFYGTVYGLLIPLEEKFLLERFGEPYDHYRKAVNPLFPKLKPYSNPSGSFAWSAAFPTELHTLIPFVLAVVVLGLKIA